MLKRIPICVGIITRDGKLPGEVMVAMIIICINGMIRSGRLDEAM